MNRQTILVLLVVLVPSLVLSATVLVVLAVRQDRQRPASPQHISTPAPQPAAPRDGHTRVATVSTGWPRFVPANPTPGVAPQEPGRHRPENVNTRIIPAITRHQPGSRP